MATETYVTQFYTDKMSVSILKILHFHKVFLFSEFTAFYRNNPVYALSFRTKKEGKTFNGVLFNILLCDALVFRHVSCAC